MIYITNGGVASKLILNVQREFMANDKHANLGHSEMIISTNTNRGISQTNH